MLDSNKPTTMTASEVAEWEAADVKRRKVKHVVFESEFSDKGDANFFVVKPKRELQNVLAEIATEKKSGWVEKTNELLLNGCIIAGDVDLLTQDDDLYRAVLGEITDLVEAKKKKL